MNKLQRQSSQRRIRCDSSRESEMVGSCLRNIKAVEHYATWKIRRRWIARWSWYNLRTNVSRWSTTRWLFLPLWARISRASLKASLYRDSGRVSVLPRARTNLLSVFVRISNLYTARHYAIFRLTLAILRKEVRYLPNWYISFPGDFALDLLCLSLPVLLIIVSCHIAASSLRFVIFVSTRGVPISAIMYCETVRCQLRIHE